ncbi:hypothetical protein ACUNG5_10975 [Serratia sp. IR-2025]
MDSEMHPVSAAVEPLRAASLERAASEARAVIERVCGWMEAVDWDAQQAAPYPDSRQSRLGFQQAKARYTLVRLLTEEAPNEGYRSYRPNAPEPRVLSLGGMARFISSATENADTQYTAFIAKLTNKVGDVTEATLTGSHVWGHSILTVDGPNGCERWKTQMIVNVSKLGNMFNQWPTRKIK